jgi:uncharacterized membrane protein (UPF0182 family)
VIASPRQVVWASTLSDALRLLLAAEAGSSPPPSPGPSPGPSPTPGPSPGSSPAPSAAPGPSATPGTQLPNDVPGLIDFANQHFELAQSALREGDFARYGSEIALVQAALQRLQQLQPGLASPIPGASPVTSPAP